MLHSFARHLLTGIGLLASVVSHAQMGYVVGIQGDTLKGRVDILSYDVIDRVEVRDVKKINLVATKVRVVVIDKETYLPVRYEQTYRLMKVVRPGYASLMLMRSPNQTLYNTPYLLKRDGKGVEVPGFGFKRVIGDLLGDCGDIGDKIRNGSWNRSDLDSVLIAYNACVESNSRHEPAIDAAAKNKLESVAALVNKVGTVAFSGQKDALDLLRDIQQKVADRQTVPNYMWSGLKEYLKDQPVLLKAADELRLKLEQ
ncbi:MAG: hypothetical protein K1X47_09385 [Cyclobacteriaceae bacterium]|nr:hypothetical protein [Cyclobacteriaceae bacterium]